MLLKLLICIKIQSIHDLVSNSIILKQLIINLSIIKVHVCPSSDCSIIIHRHMDSVSEFISRYYLLL